MSFGDKRKSNGVLEGRAKLNGDIDGQAKSNGSFDDRAKRDKSFEDRIKPSRALMDEERLRLYGVTDRSWLGSQTLAEQVEACLRGGATILQLREKALDKADFLREAHEIKKLCKKYGVPFIVNDDVEIALACDADGVHVGQKDMEAGAVRERIGPNKILGVSAQTVEQALLAQERGADYLGAGTVFPTSTKPDADFVSRETLKAICSAVEIPVVAIGGIGRKNIMQLAGTGIQGVAVVSALFAQSDIEAAARELGALSEKVSGAEGKILRDVEMEGAIFDMDGTLLDSMSVWTSIGEIYLKSQGITSRPDLLDVLRPMCLKQAAEYFAEEYGVKRTVEEIIEDVNGMIATQYREVFPCKPLALELLEELKGRGVKISVATATDPHLAEMALKRTGIYDYLTGIYSCTHVDAGKDQPDVFLYALKEMGTKKEKTYVFEDALYALKTAREAGFPTVGVYDLSAEGQREEIIRLSDFYLYSFRDWFL